MESIENAEEPAGSGTAMRSVALVILAVLFATCSQLPDSAVVTDPANPANPTGSAGLPHGTFDISLADTTNHYGDSLGHINDYIKWARPGLLHPIIILRKTETFPVRFVAFHASCSYDSCDVGADGGIFTCPCCHSQFESDSGKFIKPPATAAMTKFTADYDSTAKSLKITY